MAHTAVTVSQYGAFIDSGGASQARWWSPAGWAWRQGAGEGWGREDRRRPDGWETQCQRAYHPVVGITWFEAEAYCAWLGDQKKRAVCLPAEPEWERAARGDDDRPFPWGDAFDTAVTNTLETGLNDTVPAASLTQDASPYGVLEMGGNVQEWTASAYTAGADEVYASERLYVARGGSPAAILDGRSQPVVWSPGDQSWVDSANQTWRDHQGQPLISQTYAPTVFAPE